MFFVKKTIISSLAIIATGGVVVSVIRFKPEIYDFFYSSANEDDEPWNESLKSIDERIYELQKTLLVVNSIEKKIITLETLLESMSLEADTLSSLEQHHAQKYQKTSLKIHNLNKKIAPTINQLVLNNKQMDEFTEKLNDWDKQKNDLDKEIIVNQENIDLNKKHIDEMDAASKTLPEKISNQDKEVKKFQSRHKKLKNNISSIRNNTKLSSNEKIKQIEEKQSKVIDILSKKTAALEAKELFSSALNNINVRKSEMETKQKNIAENTKQLKKKSEKIDKKIKKEKDKQEKMKKSIINIASTKDSYESSIKDQTELLSKQKLEWSTATKNKDDYLTAIISIEEELKSNQAKRSGFDYFSLFKEMNNLNNLKTRHQKNNK